MADKKLESITFPDLPDRYVVKPDIADVTGLQTALDGKADTDGTIANAEQLHSTVGATDTEPFSFRTSGGSLNIGDREELTLVGVDVGWNQLVQTSSTSVTVQSGHKYYANINGTKSIGASNGSAIAINDGAKDNVIDLTQLLSSTIADYIYTLEQGTAGAGVAFFTKYFGTGYKAYDGGSLQSPVVKGIKMTGFNQFDEEWSTGGINTSTGVPDSDANRVHSTNYMRCVPSTTYYCKHTAGTTLQPFYYDADKNYIEYYSGNISNSTFTTPANACYMMFRTIDTAVTKGGVNINLHWDGERDGEYEAYKEYYYPITPDPLHGIMTIEDGKLKADGDVRRADGSKDVRYGEVDLGGLNWIYYTGGTNPIFQATVSDMVNNLTNGTIPKIVCPKYNVAPVNARSTFSENEDNSISIVTGNNVVLVRNTSYTDADVFKTAMSGRKLVYPLATPTTDTADPFTSPMIVDDWGTEEFRYNDGTTKFVPVGHSTKYLPNLKAKLEMSPDSPNGDGVYVVEQVGGINTYVPLASADTITSIISRIEDLENA